jgi:hypothetical protein
MFRQPLEKGQISVAIPSTLCGRAPSKEHMI